MKDSAVEKNNRAKKRTAAMHAIFRKWALTRLQSCAQTRELVHTISQMQTVYAGTSLNHLLCMLTKSEINSDNEEVMFYKVRFI